MKYKIDQLRVWLAYYILPKDARMYLTEALSYKIKELEREVKEFLMK